MCLKLSARNRLKGTIEEVKEGIVTAKVRIKIEGPTVITAVVTKDAVKDLEIKAGDSVEAIIKSTEVIIGKE